MCACVEAAWKLIGPPLVWGQLLARVRPRASDPEKVEIHFHKSQVADFSGMHVLNVLAEQYKSLGKTLHLRHLNATSTKLLRKADDLAEHFSYSEHEVASDETMALQTPFVLHAAKPGSYVRANGSPRRRPSATSGASGSQRGAGAASNGAL